MENKYEKVPEQLKTLKRWVCYKVEDRNGNQTKVPINAINGNYARSNDPSTWTRFQVALNGCEKYGCEGIGFMLGNGTFGVDLDNHPDKDGNCMPEEEFNKLANEFIDTLNSYAEYSRSGKGVHIICAGKLPEGRRRKGSVEMYDSARFFAFTGNVIKALPVEERTQEIIPLWKKYVDDSEEIKQYAEQHSKYKETDKYKFLNYDSDYRQEIELNDDQILNKAMSSSNGAAFNKLFCGDMSDYDNDHSSADLAFCSLLAFWCNKDKAQMDRIFRSSGLMRDKWDQKRGSDTYGNITLDKAIRGNVEGYIKTVSITPYQPKKRVEYIDDKPEPVVPENVPADNVKVKEIKAEMNVDAYGDPIFRIKRIYKRYPLSDTGNAMRFYDHFGNLFRFNKENKVFVFWTGKTWETDVKDIIRKYCNKMIDIMKDEQIDIQKEIIELQSTGDANKADQLKEYSKEFAKNVARFANKAGKDAMLSEFQSICDIAAVNNDFDRDNTEYLLNTDSGVVDLRTGELQPYDPKLMISRNTNIKVSYEEPTVWLKFLKDIFQRDDEEETQQIIDCIQMCVGYSLSGSISQQCMFLLYGDGSNGKSTFTNVIAKITGEYGTVTPSDTLVQKQNQNASITYSIAALKGARYVQTSETEQGERLAEARIKALTSGEKIQAQVKYGNPFEFLPKCKIWMSTNNKPVIRGNDFGIWRRIFPFPFLRRFTEKEKDIHLQEKLEKEADKILGWAIKGFQKYYALGDIPAPDCIKKERLAYQQDMDVLTQFIIKNCVGVPKYFTPVNKFFDAYKNWSSRDNEWLMKSSQVEREMKKKGYPVILHEGQVCYVGIKLNSDTGKAYVFDNYDAEAI